MLHRRTFVKLSAASGGALLFGLHLGGCSDTTPNPDPEPDPTPEPVPTADLNAYVRIGTDDSVTLFVIKAEMGQGVLTALPMILAEELEADWSKVRSEHALANQDAYGLQFTGGSTSVRFSYDALRQVGAAAREMLIAAAAMTWGVDPGECRADNGTVIHDGSGQQARYGELAELAATLPVPENPQLKDRKDFRIIGTPAHRLDTPAKADGTAVFGLDVELPDLLTAQVARCPVFGGSAASFDASAAKEVPGVVDVVEIPSGIAVIGEHFWAAQKGRAALSITWNEGEQRELNSQGIMESMKAMVDEGTEVRREGNPEDVIAEAAQSLEAVYELPYLAHAAMEPLNCTADVRADRCEIWAPTQAQTPTHDLAAQITGLPKENITLRTTLLGGGFGRRAALDFATDAIHASKAVGRPVKVVWTREDDTKGGYYRPCVYNRLRGSVDADGWPNAWEHKIVTPSLPPFGPPPDDDVDPTAIEGAVNLPYNVGNILITYKDPEIAIPTFFWRSVGSSQNAYVTECFFDELAALGNKDPVEARLHLLENHPRHRRVLEMAADKAGWGQTPPADMGRGIALHESFGTIVAEVADVSINDDGTVRVHKVVCVVDCGEVINPNTVEAQMESSIVYGLSAALYGQIDIDNGRVMQSNFHNYQVLRITEMPQVDVHIIAEGDPIGGIGEPGLPPIAPAVCNALFALEKTTTRIRKLPIQLA